MCLGLDARTALWYTIAADSVWPPGNWTPAAQRGLTGGLRNANTDLRHSGCRYSAYSRRPPSFTAQIPRRAAGPVSAFFLCILYRNYIQFLVLIWRKMRKIPGFPCRFLSFLRFKVLTPAAGSDILLLQTIAWFPRNWTSGSQRGLTGGLRKQQLICAIRVAGWPARAGGLLLLQRRYPGDGRTGICVLFMHFIQELYSILSLVLAGNGE